MTDQDPDERCERLIIVIDVDSSFGITHPMRNVALQAARAALERFNGVAHTSAVRTEVDGSCEIAF